MGDGAPRFGSDVQTGYFLGLSIARGAAVAVLPLVLPEIPRAGLPESYDIPRTNANAVNLP